MGYNNKHGFLGAIDWVTILMYFLLIVAGWFAICGASYNFDMQELFSWGSRPMMQLVWMGLGVMIAFAVLMISPSIFEVGAPLFYIAMMLLLLVTIVVAPDIKGSRSWLVLGPVRLQPAEFAKVATALVLAWQCSKYKFKISSIRSYITVASFVFVPVLLILAQSETGSALVFFALFLALYREGFSGLFLGLALSTALYFIGALVFEDSLWWGNTNGGLFVVGNFILLFSILLYYIYSDVIRDRLKYSLIAFSVVIGAYTVGGIVNHFWSFDLSYLTLALIIGAAFIFIYLALREYLLRYALLAVFALGSLGFYYSVGYVFSDVMQPHQQVRIRIALGIESDIRGKGYNVDQSKIAIGSGGLWGKGFLEGTQTKLNYVPEQDTDFIFCTVGEERGFVGSSLLLLFYAGFILRIISLAERQTQTFARVYGYSVASIFLFHLFVNVGMVLGLVPVIGIPLPFFSYGGSSLWGFSFMLFIFLNLDAHR